MAIPFKKVMKRWMKEPGFKVGYDALAEEYALARLLIEARVRAKLSQVELAERMGTSQSAIARLESGKANPSLSTLRRLAKVTGTELRITLEPKKARSKKDRSKRAAVNQLGFLGFAAIHLAPVKPSNANDFAHIGP